MNNCSEEGHIEKMADLICLLRQKCALKDMYFVKQVGISSAEYNCLMQFFNINTLGMKEIGERLGITPGGVTRIISGLEKQGIVIRNISAEDRRNIDVDLTEKGIRIVNEIRQVSLDLHSEIMEQIDPEHRRSVFFAIERLIGAINVWVEGHKNK
ncbi:MAG: winged helix-turn-helix transcriptional regulator [Candidatus Krumholzibacteriota bacterium]|nr:winged helix-turn-helix transcriptional regulator [Candidatus Krumholzibacteriota bacterium]